MDLKQFCDYNHIPIEKQGFIKETDNDYHTFNSFYNQRLMLFATLVNAFPDHAWKSHKYSDGKPIGGGWFIVGINTQSGSYAYHYEAKDWKIFNCKEVKKAPELDSHIYETIEERLFSLINPLLDRKANKQSDWAAHEVKLAIETEKQNSEGADDWKYGAACYESALRAHQCLCRDSHSGYSIQITKSILNRLIDGKCLTPIEDTPDIWNEIFNKNGIKKYQCKRMSSLFKEVAKDGTVTYRDIDRVTAINIDNPNVGYHNSFTTRLIDSIFPIKMPYLPSAKSFKVVRDEFLVDPKNGDYDTVGYLYIITPDDKTIELNRYFKEENGQMVKIEKPEFNERKARRVKNNG